MTPARANEVTKPMDPTSARAIHHPAPNAAAPARAASLDAAILDVLDGGVLDAPTVATEIMRRFDDDWLRDALAELAHVLIADHARDLISHARQDAKRDQVISNPVRRALRDRYGRHVWIPGLGYKPEPDCSAVELRAAAAFLHKLAESNRARADELDALAAAVEAAGVERVSDLPARATHPAKPQDVPPARATVEPKPKVGTPARAKTKAAAR